MGAIDLVIQIEAPPSVASGMQRIGRSGHTIDQPSRGIIVPKYRGDLVACAAVTRAMHEAQIESSRYPRNPLDVLAQQIVAMVAMETWDVDELFQAVRGAAPFAELSRSIFDGVLDMLSGRYPSDDFADLRPRLTWDRLKNEATAREGAKRVAVINGGTIPDRGLYGVFLVGERGPQARVGELDEEMVFESRVGETFLLGASSWRIEEITHDKVLVSPAPGPARQDAVLESGRRRPAAGARTAHRRARAQPAPDAAGRRDQAADETSRPRRARRGEPAALPRRPGRGHRRGPRRPDDRDRAHARRARRLAHLPAVAVRRPRSTRRGRWRSSSACKREHRRATPRRCGPTTGSSSGSRRPRRRPIRRCCCRRRTKPKRWSSGSSAARRSSRRSSARRRRARCCCRAGARAGARPSGSSASARRTCSPSRRGSDRSR